MQWHWMQEPALAAVINLGALARREQAHILSNTDVFRLLDSASGQPRRQGQRSHFCLPEESP